MPSSLTMFQTFSSHAYLKIKYLAERLAANRNFQHFIVAYLTAFVALLPLGNATSLSALLAAVPGAASVAFRKVVPNPVEQAVAILQDPPAPKK